MLLRTSAATAIAKLETDTARKKHKEQEEAISAICKATGSGIGSRCTRSGEVSGGVTHISGDAGL
jgi:hypothetical protein